MEAVILPYKSLSLSSATEAGQTRAAFAAASLLYFDRLYLSANMFPGGDESARLLWVAAKLRDAMPAISARKQKRVNGLIDVSLKDNLEFINQCGRVLVEFGEFYDAVRSLADEGIVEFVPLGDLLAAHQSQTGTEDLTNVVNALTGSIWYDLAASGPRSKLWRDFKKSIAISPGHEFTSLEFAIDDGFPVSSRMYLSWGHTKDIVSQVILAKMTGASLVTDNELHYSPLRAVLGQLGDNENNIRNKALALFTSGLLAVLPPIIPRSFDAILEIRYHLKDDLAEFRSVLDSLAIEAAGDSAADASFIRDAQKIVQKELRRPLDDLHRQLAHPGRRLAQNLVTSAPVVSAGVALVASLLSGASPPEAGVISAVSGSVTTLLKTHVDRTQLVNASRVGFLFKMRRDLRRRSSLTLY